MVSNYLEEIHKIYMEWAAKRAKHEADAATLEVTLANRSEALQINAELLKQDRSYQQALLTSQVELTREKARSDADIKRLKTDRRYSLSTREAELETQLKETEVKCNVEVRNTRDVELSKVRTEAFKEAVIEGASVLRWVAVGGTLCFVASSLVAIASAFFGG